jgi:hypothetical protein
MPESFKGAGMNTPQKAISAYLLKTLVDKLRPERFPGMPSASAALVGFVLGARFCDPYIAEVAVTSRGLVLARAHEAAAKHALGSYADVLRNWLRLVSAAGLSQREFIEAQCLFASKIEFFGPTSA